MAKNSLSIYSNLKTIEIGDGIIVHILHRNSYDGACPIYYEIYRHEKLIIPATYLGIFDDFKKDTNINISKIIFDADKIIVVIIHLSKQRLFVVCNLASGESLPRDQLSLDRKSRLFQIRNDLDFLLSGETLLGNDDY